jgi:tripeptidyl-peptidase-1
MTDPPRATAGACTLFTAVDAAKPAARATGAVSGGSMYAGPPKLYASWPASSAWVTAVGATRFVGQVVGAEEMASDGFGSGGGFSGRVPRARAPYQAAAVAAYLRGADEGAPFPPPGAYNAAGRATPDVAALGEGYDILVNGRASAIGGTSASTPAFAALVSLLNEARLQRARPPMGFLNPWLYRNAAAMLTDITKGSNAIGRGNVKLKYGYNCTRGWDPVTGLGTPRFGKMLAAAMADVRGPA